MSNNLNLPGYDRWLDAPFQQDMDARAAAEEDDAELDQDDVRADLDLDGVDD